MIKTEIFTLYNDIRHDKDKVRQLLSQLFAYENGGESVHKLNKDKMPRFFNSLFEDYFLSDFEDLSVTIKQKKYSFYSIFAANIVHYPEKLINIDFLEKEYMKDPYKCFKLICTLNNKNYFTTIEVNWIITKYDMHNDKEKSLSFLSSTSTLKNLKLLEGCGLNVWIPLTRNDSPLIEVLLPAHVLEKEYANNKNITKMSLNNLDVISFFDINKWKNIKTENTTSAQFVAKTLLIQLLNFDTKQFSSALKAYKLKEQNLLLEDKFKFIKEKKIYSIKEILLLNGRHTMYQKIVKKNPDQDLFSTFATLLKSEPIKIDLISKKNDFYKIWITLIDKVNFQEVKEGKNILNLILDRKAHSYKNMETICYLPINKNNLNKTQEEANSYSFFDNDYSKESSRQEALNKILNFLHNKDVNFLHRYNDKIVLNEVISSCMDFIQWSRGYDLLSENGLIYKIYEQAPLEDRIKIWKDFVIDFDRHLTPSHIISINSKINSYGIKNERILLVLNMFNNLLFKKDYFSSTEWDEVLPKIEFMKKDSSIQLMCSEIEKINLYKKINNNLSVSSEKTKKFKI